MAILGDDRTPNVSYFFDDFGNTEWWDSGLVMPAGGGIITQCNVYVGGDGGSVTGQLVIWGSSLAIAWQSGNITIPGGSRSVGGQGWVRQNVPSVYMPAGAMNIGWWSSGNVVWTQESSGLTYYKRSVSSPGSISGSNNEGNGGPGAYIVYTPGGIARVRRSSSWTVSQAELQRSGVKVNAQVLVRRSSAWVNAT